MSDQQELDAGIKKELTDIEEHWYDSDKTWVFFVLLRSKQAQINHLKEKLSSRGSGRDQGEVK